MKIPLLIDSGAYSLWAHQERIRTKRTKKLTPAEQRVLRESITVDMYAEFLHAVLQQDPTVEYVNLDVIGDGKASYRNWKALRSLGLDPLPVYHVVTDVKWLKKYLAHTDRIGLGAIVNMSYARRIVALDRVWSEYLTKPDGYPTVKAHGMGITDFGLMWRYPWYSVDSTSWMQVGNYGSLYLPKKRNGEWAWGEKPFVLSFSRKSPNRRIRGKHYENVSPSVRKMLEEYLEYLGVPFGKTEVVDGEERVVERGVSNYWRPRRLVNAIFFSRFSETLVWPRPLRASYVRGLFTCTPESI